MIWQETKRYPPLLHSVIDTYFYYLSLNLFTVVNSRFKYATQEGRGEDLNRVLR